MVQVWPTSVARISFAKFGPVYVCARKLVCRYACVCWCVFAYKRVCLHACVCVFAYKDTQYVCFCVCVCLRACVCIPAGPLPAVSVPYESVFTLYIR